MRVTWLGMLFLPALVLSFVAGVVMIIGARKMMRLESYRWAMAASIAALLPCNPVSMLGLVMGIWSLVVLNRRNVIAAFAAPMIVRGAATPSIESATRPAGSVSKPVQAPQKSNALVWVVVVLAVLMLAPCLVIPVIFLGYWGFATSPMPSSRNFSGSTAAAKRSSSFSEEHVTKPAEPVPESLSGWILRSEGPALTDGFAREVLKLQPAQTERVKEILQAVYREYLTIEQQNTEQRTDEAGHTLVTIKPFPDAIARLEDKLWSQLDEVLDPQQQETARLNLRLDPLPLRGPISLSEIVGPGLFGWGKEGARLEFWRVGTWHHWKVQTRGYEYESRAPQLPEEYRRFSKEGPAEAVEPSKDPLNPSGS